MTLRKSSSEFTGTNRYQIEGVLGGGAMGVVYQVRDREHDTQVALKTMRNVDPSALLRFKSEFRSIADVNHRNLASLYELVACDDTWFFTMELVEGTDFVSWVRHGSAAAASVHRGDTAISDTAFARTVASDDTEVLDGSAPDQLAIGSSPSIPVVHPPLRSAEQLERLRAGARQMIEGLAALHANGKLHRDVKPSNVLVAGDGRVVVLDFGLVADARTADRDRVVAGTPAYMAPEQASAHGISIAADWYGVGVVLYEALTGRLPYHGSTVEILHAKQTVDAIDPRTYCPDAPSDLADLIVELLRRDPARRPSARAILRRLGGAPSRAATPLPIAMETVAPVGRESQLADLAQAYFDAFDGENIAVFVSGRSGMGKSTLLDAFLGRLDDLDGALVLRGRCYQRETVPYKAVDSLVDALTRALDELDEERLAEIIPDDVSALARVFPVLRRVPLIDTRASSTTAPDPQELRLRGFAGLRELLARLGAERRVVICIDDLQWGDADSAVALGEILADGNGLLFVGAFRAEDAESTVVRALLEQPALASMGERLRKVELPPLDRRASEELAAGLLGRHPQSASAIALESGGNPYFVTELVRHVRSGEDTAAGSIFDSLISLDEVLYRRIDALAPPARRLLEVIALAGQPIDERVAYDAAAVDNRGQVVRALLEAERLIECQQDRHAVQMRAFHDRVRETVVHHLDAETAKERHRRLARALVRAGDPDPEALGAHYAAAGELAAASHRYEAAADRASDALAFDRAARLYRRTLELVGPGGDEERVGGLRRKLADSLAYGGRSAEAGREYLAAISSSNDTVSLALRRRAAEQFLLSGHYERGVEIMKDVMSSVGLPFPEGRRAIAGIIGRRAQLKMRGLRARVRPAAEVPPAQHVALDLCWSASIGMLFCDYLVAFYFHNRHLLLALDVGDPLHLALALAFESGMRSSNGRHAADTAALLNRARALADQADSSHARGHVALAASVAPLYDGRWAEALEHCRTAAAIFRDECTGVAWERTNTALATSIALYYLGDFQELRRHVPATLGRAAERGNLLGAMGMRTGHPNAAWLAADDIVGAREAADAALRGWAPRSVHIHHYDVIANCQIDLYNTNGGAALSRVRQRWGALASSRVLKLQRPRIEAHQLRARCALAAVDAGAGDEILRIAIGDCRRLRREKNAWATAFADLVEAAIVYRKGDADNAARLLESAAAGFGALGMRAYQSAAHHRMGELRGGEAGDTETRAAAADLNAAGVVNPERMVAMMAPGFGSLE